MALPTNIGYGTVTGRFMEAVADSVDTGREPDGNPLVNMAVNFIPAVGLVRSPSTPAMIAMRSISGRTNSSGILVGADGVAGVTLVATDDTDITPSGWTWRVEIPDLGIYDLNISMPQGTSIDLTTVIPVPGSGGATVSDAYVRSVMSSTLVAGTNVTLTAVGNTIVVAATGGGGSSTPATDTVAGIVELATTAETTTGTDTTRAVTPAGVKAVADTKVPSTRTVAGKPLSADVAIAKADVGLGSVDNTSDASKPVSTSQQAALSLKQDANTAPELIRDTIGSALVAGANVAIVVDDAADTITISSSASGSGIPTGGTTGQALKKNSNANGDASWATLVKADVGLGSVDNTTDASKPVSTAQQAALDLKAPLSSPIFTGNPTAPTPTTGDNDTSVATTAFVTAAITAALSAVTASNIVYYNTSTNTWPSRPSSSNPVIAISTKSPAAPRPTWLVAGQYDGDIWLPDPDSVVG